MSTYSTYEENQKKLMESLKETQSYKDDDPFYTYYERQNAFESFLHTGAGLGSCGCGDPEKTWTTILDALDYCALTDGKWDKRSPFLKEKFGVEYVSDNGLVQFLFYILDSAGFTEHGGSVNGSWLTDAGKVFRELLRRHLNELDVDQVLKWEFEIDFDALLAK